MASNKNRTGASAWTSIVAFIIELPLLNFRQKKAHKKLWANLNIKLIEGSLIQREHPKKSQREITSSINRAHTRSIYSNVSD